MIDLVSHLVDAPIANILILAGLAFLAIGILGKISSRIEASTASRTMSGILGLLLVVFGVYVHAAADTAGSQTKQTPGNQASTNPRPQNLVKEAPEGISGFWKNANPQTRSITRLEVQRHGNLVTVHAWSACSPQECDWGTANGYASGKSANVTWDQGFVLRKMTLLHDAGRLRMELESAYKDNRLPQQALDYFVPQ